jgi:hypothetical protein
MEDFLRRETEIKRSQKACKFVNSTGKPRESSKTFDGFAKNRLKFARNET